MVPRPPYSYKDCFECSLWKRSKISGSVEAYHKLGPTLIYNQQSDLGAQNFTYELVEREFITN